MQVDINGIPMTLLDTAGIRRTADKVEAIGVARSGSAANDADAILFVYDSAVCLYSQLMACVLFVLFVAGDPMAEHLTISS
jgi:tRNA U34 5-carboxymethylaminomethyl modifying GTPase MnmE/TrmE